MASRGALVADVRKLIAFSDSVVASRPLRMGDCLRPIGTIESLALAIV